MLPNLSQASREASPLFIHRQDPRLIEGYQVFEVALDSGHPILGGHFPGMPVVPGVMQLTLVRQCAEKILGFALRWAQIEKAKFFTPWTPETGPTASVRLKLNRDESGTSWRIEAFIVRDAINFLSVKGLLEPC